MQVFINMLIKNKTFSVGTIDRKWLYLPEFLFFSCDRSEFRSDSVMSKPGCSGEVDVSGLSSPEVAETSAWSGSFTLCEISVCCFPSWSASETPLSLIERLFWSGEEGGSLCWEGEGDAISSGLSLLFPKPETQKKTESRKIILKRFSHSDAI